MASIHKRDGSPYWYAAFYHPDGKRAFRSTKVTDRKKAMAICLQYDRAAQLAREGRLSETRAREVIADIYAVMNRDKLPSDSIRDYVAGWMAKKALELADSSLSEYRKITDELLKHLGEQADKPMDALTVRQASAFRDSLANRVSGGTTNKYIKIARVLWRQAVKEGQARDNIFAKVDLVRVERSSRRPFSLPELKATLEACDPEWRAMVIAGLYTGQRLSDISSLTWRQVDFAERVIHFHTRKTGRHINIPLAKPLQAALLQIPSSDDPAAPLFPNACGNPTNTLSRQFGEILMSAGLVKERDHQKHGEGRSVRRNTDFLSFHCLRHTATSLLKNAGVSDVVAREIIGHDSEAVSRVYTHIETDTLRAAVDLLPDITAPDAAKAGKKSAAQ